VYGLAVGAGQTDADRLREIVDAHENEIEPPGPDAAAFELGTQQFAEF
jgi:hypothetical protein